MTSPRKFSGYAHSAAKSRSVSRHAGVVLTCGGFENNQEMIRNYLPGVPCCYTSGSPYNEGDEIAMATAVGAPTFGTFSKQMPGGVIVVGPDARRFADEKYKTRHGKVPVNGRWLPLSTPCPMFMILYHPHARCYLKSVIPAISDNACCVSGTKIR